MINLCKLSSLHAHLQGKCLYILCMCVCAVVQLCPTLYKPMDYSLPGSSVHGTFQARILEGVAISFSKGPSQPRDWALFSLASPALTDGFFATVPPVKIPGQTRHSTVSVIQQCQSFFLLPWLSHIHYPLSTLYHSEIDNAFLYGCNSW